MTDLRSLVLRRDELADMSPAERRLALRSLAREAGIDDPATAVAEVAEEIDGFGPLTALMMGDITDVLVNGPHDIWVERGGELRRTDVKFRDETSLLRFLERMLGRAGARLDRSQPIADARLPDGSRIHAVLPPVAPSGPLVSIRRFPAEPFSLDGLVAGSMMTAEQAEILRSLVRERRSIVIAGRTGTGKSTLLDALLGIVPPEERIVTIEELPELRTLHPHRVALLARGANVEGRGAITLDELVRAALRMRPDRIVVGEVRGAESLTALEAMSTGHAGSMMTVHARGAEVALDRLLTLALQASSGASESSLQRQIDDAIDAVVFLDRDHGRRRVATICICD